jgi:hypothetical protein
VPLLRVALVALLVASTALFAVGVVAERSGGETHTERAAPREGGEAGKAEAPAEHGEAGEAKPAAEHGEAGEATPAAEHGEGERLLGVDAESTPLVVLATLAGLTLAALAATPLGLVRGFLLTVVFIALAWAALDIREVIHQLDESRTGVALIALAVAALHLAVVATSGRLATST